MAMRESRQTRLTPRAHDDLKHMVERLSTALGRSVTHSTVMTVCAQLVDMTPDPVLRYAAREAFQLDTTTVDTA